MELEQAERRAEAHEGARSADDGGRPPTSTPSCGRCRPEWPPAREAVTRHERDGRARRTVRRGSRLPTGNVTSPGPHLDRERRCGLRRSRRIDLAAAPDARTCRPCRAPGSWAGPPPEVVAAVVAEEGRPTDAAEALQRVVQRERIGSLGRSTASGSCWPGWARSGRWGRRGRSRCSWSASTPPQSRRRRSPAPDRVDVGAGPDDRGLRRRTSGRWCDGLDVDVRLLRWSPWSRGPTAHPRPHCRGGHPCSAESDRCREPPRRTVGIDVGGTKTLACRQSTGRPEWRSWTAQRACVAGG